MGAKESRAELEEHLNWCADKMRKSRDAIGDALVCVSDANGNIAPNPAFSGYLQIAKEFRASYRQLEELGAPAEEKSKSALSSLRLIAGSKREAI